MIRLLAVAALLVSVVGCSDQNDAESPGAARDDAALRLLVVDDPELAAAAGLLRGEWKGQTGGSFEVQQTSTDELLSAADVQADAVIFPSSLLGSLAEKKLLAPVPVRLLEEDAANWSRIFSLLRGHEAVWGTDTFAVPFGSPVLVCYYRADLLEKLGRQPPTTWKEYQGLAELLADRAALGEAAPPEGSPWHGAIEPLAPGWAGLVLLARAASYATHREHFSTLFNLDTMEPLIAGPPFVRALEELVAAAGPQTAERPFLDPAGVRAAFWQGQCGLALTWPTATVKDLKPAEPKPRVGFAELPGSREVYDFAQQRWEDRGEGIDHRVTLLSVSGRLGAVARSSAVGEAAIQLLLWLSGEQWSREVSRQSSAVTLYRESHVLNPAEWVEPTVPADAAVQYAEVAQLALTREQRLFAFRLPGHGEYLAALDEAALKALRGEQTAESALSAAATRWEEITERLGREAQRDAYARSLGL